VLDRLIVKCDIDQTDAELLRGFNPKGVEIRLAGQLGRTYPGGTVTLPQAAVDTLAHPSLGTNGGGEVLTDPHDPKGMRTMLPQFETHVELDNPGGEFFAGQRAYVRFTLDNRPLAWQWTRRFWQLLQSHDNGKWL